MADSKEEKETPPPPPPPSPPLKFYLNKSTTYTGKVLLQELSADPTNGQAVMGKHTFVTSDSSISKESKDTINETWKVISYILLGRANIGLLF